MPTPRHFPLTIFALLCCLLPRTYAGPPFFTDDPEPVEPQHWELYLATMDFKNADGWTGTAPHIELNYGAMPGLQLHLLTQMSYDAPKDGTHHIGYGDTELGFKLRFLEEGKDQWWPEVAIFPVVELPTGNHSLGLGNGKAQAEIPVWLQKTFGKWSTNAGAAWWYNPTDDGNHNYWFVGWQVQRKITENFALGAEIFHNSDVSIDGLSGTGMNLGFIWDITENYHLIGSAGHSVEGPAQTFGYLGVQFTWGPEKAGEKGEAKSGK